MPQVTRSALKSYGEAGDILTENQWIDICDSFALVSELGGGGGGGSLAHALTTVTTVVARMTYSGNAPVLTELSGADENTYRFTIDNTSLLLSVEFDCDVADLNSNDELILYIKSDAGHILRPKGIEMIAKNTNQAQDWKGLGVGYFTEISDVGEIKATFTNMNTFTSGVYVLFTL